MDFHCCGVVHLLEGSPISKALVWKFTCTNKNGKFVKETDTSGYIVV